jgi:hypothetical protein
MAAIGLTNGEFRNRDLGDGLVISPMVVAGGDCWCGQLSVLRPLGFGMLISR